MGHVILCYSNRKETFSFLFVFFFFFAQKKMYIEKSDAAEVPLSTCVYARFLAFGGGGGAEGGVVELQTYEWNLAASLQVMGTYCRGQLSNKWRQLL